MDGIQLLLVIVIISLTSLLLVVGYQAFLVIKEIRFVVKRINNLLDHPQEKITSFFNDLRKK